MISLPIPRRIRTTIFFFCIISFFLIGSFHIYTRQPDYSGHYYLEASILPKHATSQGKRGRSLVLFDQVTGVGFNNQLQEILLLASVASAVNRTYVHRDISFRDTFGRVRYAPFSVFVKSVQAGQPLVSHRIWPEVCGTQPTTIQAILENEDPDLERLSSTVELLKNEVTSCVHVTGWITDWRCDFHLVYLFFITHLNSRYQQIPRTRTDSCLLAHSFE